MAGFLVDKFDGQAGSGAGAAFFAVVFGYSTKDVGGGAGVKNAVSAP